MFGFVWGIVGNNNDTVNTEVDKNKSKKYKNSIIGQDFDEMLRNQNKKLEN
jgi:hypothetical protein